MMSIQSIFRTVAFGLLFILLTFLSAFGQDFSKYSPGAVWVKQDRLGLKFHPDGRVDTFNVPTMSGKVGSYGRVSFYSLASLFFPKTGNYIYTEPYLNFKFIYNSDSTDIIYRYAWFGVNLRDSSHQIIPNGDSLMLGDSRGTTRCLMLPINGKTSYFLHIGVSDNKYEGKNVSFEMNFFRNPRIRLTKIINSDSGLKVTTRDSSICSIDVTGGLVATRHGNGRDWWLLAHERNASNGFLKFLIRQDGQIITYPTQYIGAVRCTNWGATGDTLADMGVCVTGEMRFNYYGNTLALAHAEHRIVEIFDFDRCNGLLSNIRIIKDFENKGGPFIDIPAGDCTPSPDGKNIFLTPSGTWMFNYLDVIDMENPKQAEFLRRTRLDSLNFTASLITFHPYDSTLIISPYLRNFIAQIKYPNRKGFACGLDTNYIRLAPDKRNYQAIPNMPNYLLGASEQKMRDFRRRIGYRDTICAYEQTELKAYYLYGKFKHSWSPQTGLDVDTGWKVTFRPPKINTEDTVYTFIVKSEPFPGSCMEGQIAFDTLNVFVYGNGRGGCRTVSRLDAIPPQVIQIYPNPTNGTLYIKSSWERMDKVMLFTMEGKLVFERNLSDTEAELFVGDLSDGVYLCKITTTEGIFTQKVVIKK